MPYLRSDESAHAEAVKQYPYVIRTADDVQKMLAVGRSQFKAPDTARISISKPDNSIRANKPAEMTLHLVNYNREEPPRGRDGKPSPGGGIKDEKPIPCGDVECDVILSKGDTVQEVIALSPEEADGTKLQFKVIDDRVKFTAPGFLVYRVVRILLK
jgi:hypothetical protein